MVCECSPSASPGLHHLCVARVSPGARGMGTCRGADERNSPRRRPPRPLDVSWRGQRPRTAEGRTARARVAALGWTPAPAAAANWASSGRCSAHVQEAPEFHFVTFKCSGRRSAGPGGARQRPPAAPAAPPPQVKWEGAVEQGECRPPSPSNAGVPRQVLGFRARPLEPRSPHFLAGCAGEWEQRVSPRPRPHSPRSSELPGGFFRLSAPRR